MSGCWPNYVTPLLRIHWAFSVFFIWYVSVVVFAVIRIITAIFLKQTMDYAASDAATMIADQMRKQSGKLVKVSKIFDAADPSGNGLLSLSDTELLLDNPRVAAYLVS